MNNLRQMAKTSLPKNLVPQVREFYRFLKALRYIGNRYQCPCCGWRLSRFLDGGRNEARQNASCPRCASLERHRWLWLELEHRHRLDEPLRLLHFAPERCFRRQFVKLPHLNYVTTDLWACEVKTQMDITQLAFGDNTFGGIICSHVLEHIPDDRAAMRELFRVLKLGGWAYVAVPIYWDRDTYEDSTIVAPQERLRAFGQEDHVRYYGRDIVDRLINAGFQVQVQHAGDMEKDVVEKYRFNQDELMFLCTKPCA